MEIYFLISSIFFTFRFLRQGLFIVMGVFPPSALIRSVYCLHLWCRTLISFLSLLLGRQGEMENVRRHRLRGCTRLLLFPLKSTNEKKWQCWFLRFKLCQCTPLIGSNWGSYPTWSSCQRQSRGTYANTRSLAHSSSLTADLNPQNGSAPKLFPGIDRLAKATERLLRSLS